jgi:hypothetical protein
VAFSILTQSFEELPNGTTITTGNTGNPSAAFDAISSLTSGQTLASDNSNGALVGSMALKVATGATLASADMDWSTSLNWQAQTWWEAGLFFTANPATASGGNILTFLQSGTTCGRIRISTSGKVLFLDAAGATQLTSTASISLNTWIRLEGYITGNASTGQAEFKLFNTGTSTTPTETQTSGATLNTAGTPNTGRWALAQGLSNAGPFWMDALGLSVLGYIGFPTAISGSDTGSGADAFTALVVVGLETASGTDSQSIKVSSSDSATSAEAGGISGNAITDSDTWAGTDSGRIVPTDTDSGTFTEAATIKVSDTDAGTGNDEINTPRDSDSGQAAENPSLIHVSDTDAFSGVDVGGFATQHAVSDTDTGSFSENLPAIRFARGSGAGPSFPLIFQMSTVPGVRSDSGHFTESQSIAVAVASHDFGHFSETQNFPGGPPPPSHLLAEGFSITHAGVLLPGLTQQQGKLYAVRSAQISPQWVTTVTQMDDQVVNVWNAPGSVQVTIQGGFMPWGVLADIMGTSVTSSGLTPLDYYALPLFQQKVSAQLPLVIRASARDAAGNQRQIQFVAYAAQFGSIAFDGPVYKNGLTVSYTVTLLLSSQDETGQVLPDRAYGRVMSMPPNTFQWTPNYNAPVQVADSDSGTFFDTGTAGPVGGTQHVSDTDTGHFSEGQRVSSGIQQITDTDSGHFAETRQVAGPMVFVSDSDFFSARPRAGLVGSTTPKGDAAPPTTRMASATLFDNAVGRDMAIMSQKIYYEVGEFPTTYDSQYTALVATGCQIWLCYQPAFDGSDAAALSASISALMALTPGPVKVVLWQEPQNGGIFPSATQFVNLMQSYYPVVNALGVPLVYDSATHAGVSGVTNYFPLKNGVVYCDEAVADYYCSTFTGLDNSNGTTPLALEALARKYNLPFGFGELGTALSQAEANNVTQVQFTSYIAFIIGLLVGRLQTGLFNSDCMWYNGDNTSTPTWNTITSSSDYRVAQLQLLFDTLSRQKESGGAEGGGESPVAPLSSNGVLRGGFKGARIAQFIGAVSSQPTTCPVSVTDWINHGNPTLGPLDCIKMFYSGTQVMDTFQNGHLGSDNESQLPPGIVPFITYKDSQIPSLAKYVASIPDDRLVYLSYWQEAEDSYPGGNYTQFIKTTIQCSNIIRSVGKANVKIWQNSAGSQYGVVGSTAQQGFWRVPPEYVDAYTVDSYQRANQKSYPSQGLANYPAWLHWLSVYADQGRQLGITEYGISNATAAQRNARIQLDAAYLRTAFPPSALSSTQVSPFPMLLWLYWWSNCSAGSIGAFTNQFSDTPTITTWQQIGAGTL